MENNKCEYCGWFNESHAVCNCPIGIRKSECEKTKKDLERYELDKDKKEKYRY